MSKPYKYPAKGVAWKLEKNSVTTNADAQIKVEVVARFPTNYVQLSVRYVQKPYPIILETFTTTDYANIDGEHTASPCRLPEHLHNEILSRAVDLAKAVWESRTGNVNRNQ